MNYPSPFGNEYKLKLEDYLASETLETVKHIALDIKPIILGVTYWKCCSPWQVPERKICDNFFLLVESGSIQVTVAGELRILRRGEAIMVPEYTSHSFGLAPQCTQSSHFIAHALAENIVSANPFAGFSSPFLHSKCTKNMLDILPTIVALRNDNEDAAMFLMQQQFRFLMIEHAENGLFKFNQIKPYRDSRLHKAIAFINNNFSSNIGVPDIAAQLNLGIVRFRIIFEREIGLTPANYLLRTRLLHATRLLARYDMPLAKVAVESGFAGECYFCTAFKKYFHTTPGKYRKIIRKS